MLELFPEDHNSSRRRFMKRIAQFGFAAATTVLKPFHLRADEPKNSVEEKVEQFKERIRKFGEKPAHVPLVEIGIDRDQAAKTFEQLFSLIPENERYKLPMPTGKNAYPHLEALFPQLVDDVIFFNAEDDRRVSEEIEGAIPWQNDHTFKMVESFISKNEPTMQKINSTIQESGFIARSELQKVEYYDVREKTNYETSNALRRISYHYYYRVLYYARKEDWKSVVQNLEVFSRMIMLRRNARMTLVEFLVYKAICGIYFDAFVAAARHPRIPDDVLKTFARLASQDFRVSELDFRSFQFMAQVETISLLAEIHECENVGNQYLAIHRLALPTTKLPIAPKPINYPLNFPGRKELFEKELAQSKKMQALLAHHAKPFDRTDTVQEILTLSRLVAEPIRNGTYFSFEPPFPDDYKAIYRVDEVTMLALSGLDSFFRSVLQDLTPKNADSKEEKKRLSEEERKKSWDQFVKMKNPLGKIFIFEHFLSQMLPTFFLPRALEATQCANILIALKQYERLHKTRPANLQELVNQKFLAKIENNPFTNTPWQYSAERGVIWRTGKMGTENGELTRSEIETTDPNAPQSRDEEQGVGIFRLLER